MIITVQSPTIFGKMFRKFSSVARNCAKRLEGKVCIVTASTEGIGLAIAKRLGAEGGKVVVSSRKQANVDEAVKLLQDQGATVHGIACHVGNAGDRKKLFDETIERFGGLDILVSNAAVNPEVGQVLDASEQAWDKIFDINVKSSFLLAKEAKPLLVKRGGGAVVFMSSIGGFQPFETLGAYSVSKTALFGLTKAAALDLVRENIRVNCVAPGIIETKFSASLYNNPKALELSLRNVPMKRLGKSEEIAGVVAFLVSDDASYVTGETIVAAGGWLSRL